LTEKELRKLNRYQLLELLVVQTERANKLQAQVDALQQELQAQNIQFSSLGSIAEASLQLSGIFEAAQAAADRYLAAARQQAEEILQAAQEKTAATAEAAEEQPSQDEPDLGVKQ